FQDVRGDGSAEPRDEPGRFARVQLGDGVGEPLAAESVLEPGKLERVQPEEDVGQLGWTEREDGRLGILDTTFVQRLAKGAYVDRGGLQAHSCTSKRGMGADNRLALSGQRRANGGRGSPLGSGPCWGSP